MLGEVVVSQEWYCKGNVGLGRCQISVVKCFGDNVQGSGTTWLFEIAEKSEGMVFGGSKKVRFSDCLLSSAKLVKEPLVCGQAGVEMRPVFGELPTLSFELEMLGNEGPIERWHPVGDEMVFFDPRLVVVVVGRELNRGEVVRVAVGVPVAQGEFSGDWDVVLKLLELGTAVVFEVWYADGGGAHIIVAMLMVAPLWCDGVEVEFDVN